MSSVPSRNTSSPAASGLVECQGYIVLDHAERPDRAHQLAQAAEAFHAFCKANDRPYVAAILGHEKAEVVLDLTTCSWVLCGACVEKARAVIAHFPDGPTQTPSSGPNLFRVTGLSPLGAPFLAGELIADAMDCRKRHGRTVPAGYAPRPTKGERTTRPKASA